MYDVIIVGAGPAGLSAALMLGRCRRNVLICDSGRPRNAASLALHGFLTRDGIDPAEFLRIGREQLQNYPNVTFWHGEVVEATPHDGRFEITFANGVRHSCRMLLLATGVVDELPPLEGIEAFYGRSVFHCPYCDGWEQRDQPLAVYGRGKQAVKFALEMKVWSPDIILCTNGPADISPSDRERLARHAIPVREEPIALLDGADGLLACIIFEDGEQLARSALFFTTGFRQASNLTAKLGCDFSGRGAVQTGTYESTDIPGLFVAGDASRQVQLAIVAAAEGVKAAFAINTALLKNDFA